MRSVLILFGLVLSIFSELAQVSGCEINWDNVQQRLLVPEPLLAQIHSSDPAFCNDYKNLLNDLAIGDSIFIGGKPQIANTYYKKGLHLASNLNLYWHRILFYNRLGFSNYWSENLDEAVKNYTESFNMIRSADNIEDTLAAFEAISFCTINLGKYPCGNKNEECRYSLTRLKCSINSEVLRNAKYFLLSAEYDIWKDDLYGSLSHLEQAENSIKNTAASELWLFLIRLNKAIDYHYSTDYKLAQEYLEALRIQITSNPRYEFLTFTVSYHLGVVYNFLDDYTASLKIFDEVRPLVSSKQYIHYYEYYLWLGNTYQRKKELPFAQNCFLKAAEILKERNINDLKTLKVYLFMSLFYLQGIHNPDLELKYLKLADNIIVRYPDEKYYISYLAYSFGLYYYTIQNYEKAIDYLNPVLSDLDSILSSDKYFYSKLGSLLLEDYQKSLENRSISYYYLGKKNNDLNLYNRSYVDMQKLAVLTSKIVKDVEYEKSRLTNMIELRKEYDAELNIGYDIMTNFGVDTFKNELLEVSEKSKAALLKTHLTEEMAKEKAGVPEKLIHKSAEIKKELDTLQYALIRDNGQSKGKNRDIIISEVMKKLNEYNQLDRMLEARYPIYSTLKNTNTKISVTKLQSTLSPLQSILEYHITFNSLYIFYIDKTNFKLILLPITAKFKDKLLAYRDLINNIQFNDSSKIQYREFIKQSNGLYQLLIKPVDSLIQNKHLIIVPDLELNLIPFETLLTQEYDTLKTSNDYSTLSYLILRNPVSYVYSISQLSEEPITKKGRLRFAGFVPDYDNAKSSELQINRKYQSVTGRLPGAKDEVLSALKYYKGKLYFGEEATKENFFMAASRCNIIHLAMHTVLDMNESMNSELIFSPDLSKNNKQLHAFEVCSHDINAELVVLSGCNTGNGKLSQGEGVFSIARAFLLTGVKNILITQWSIADRSSASLMAGFYEYLSKGNPVDVALQKAKIDCIRKGDPLKAHPYYWAGYVNYGNPEIFESGQQHWLYFFAAALLIVIIVFGYYRIKP
jgi:CHAT domain-containing protein